MTYLTFEPQPDLAALVKCYWTLEVPAQQDVERQLIVPDGCIEMAFILGDDIMRYISEDEFVLQPRAMVLGQITRQFYIKPTGAVDSFAVRFYPYGFASFARVDINTLSNTETPLSALFGEEASRLLVQRIVRANNTKARIGIVESFLIDRMGEKETIDTIVHEAIEAMLETKSTGAIQNILKENASSRRRLEREFRQKIGVSPKQLSKVIRLQAALKMVLNRQSQSLTKIAYESKYYDQAHFIRDFKEFTGTTPRKFLGAEGMSLSSAIYK
jgi:AraC-like DNA-binding protein